MRNGVVGARGGLRVVLDSEHRQGAVTDSLDRSVVQIHVRDLQVGRSRDSGLIALDSKTVVLRRDEHAAALHFLDWMIPAPVAIRKLGRRTTE